MKNYILFIILMNMGMVSASDPKAFFCVGLRIRQDDEDMLSIEREQQEREAKEALVLELLAQRSAARKVAIQELQKAKIELDKRMAEQKERMQVAEKNSGSTKELSRKKAPRLSLLRNVNPLQSIQEEVNDEKKHLNIRDENRAKHDRYKPYQMYGCIGLVIAGSVAAHYVFNAFGTFLSGE